MFKNKGILFLLFCTHLGFAQKIEIGAGLGPTYYKGDLQPTFRVFNPGIGGSAFVRYNASKVFSIKANVMYGLVQGNDTKSGNPLNEYRGFKFTNQMWDYNGQIEYNFLNFRTHNGRYEHNWTPYLFGGYGNSQIIKQYLFVNGVKKTNPRYSPEQILPFGIGYKKILNGKWNIGAEFGTRILMNKKLHDMFDGLGFIHGEKKSYFYQPNSGIPNYESTRYPNTLQPDKYFYVSFTVSYLFYKVYCPPKKL